MRSHRRPNTRGMQVTITPLIDMFTVILIFLIASYAPQESQIQQSDEVQLPLSDITLKSVPNIQVEIQGQAIKLNGQTLPGTRKEAWKQLTQTIQEQYDSDEPILIIADKRSRYRLVDQTVGQLASAGYSQVYFLTEKESKE